MSKSPIVSDRAPSAIGQYSQAVRVGELLFTSGQIALDPQTGALVGGGIEAETRQVLVNLTEVLAAGGATWAHVVRATVYLTDMGSYAAVNKLYGERVQGSVPPARSLVQVAALPRGASIEIDLIAHVPA